MLVYVGMSRYYINGSRRRQKAILDGEKRLGLESRQKKYICLQAKLLRWYWGSNTRLQSNRQCCVPPS